jgi:hypothetical protein
VAAFVAAALLIGLLILHSPWLGYVTRVPGGYLGNTYFEGGGDLPIWEWHSADPLIPWFGSLVNCVIVAVAVVGLAGLWCYLFRSPAGNETS